MATRVTARARSGRVDHTAVIALSGEIRFGTARALRAAIDALLSPRDHDTVVVDLRELLLIDSTGLGLLARIGRATLEQRGRRAIIVCADEDIIASLAAVAFDTLFVFVRALPFDREPELQDVPLDTDGDPDAHAIGKLVLSAHRELASLSEQNGRSFADVVTALESELYHGPRSM
jgi:anti-anti-sigma factor